MKRLLYFIITAAVALTGCTTWDDPTMENYGAGPSIEVSVAAAAPTDSAFVITIVPAEGTTYYAYVIDANDEAEELNATTLLKGGYGNSVFNTSKDKTLTVPVNGMAPNTTYQVYAVASNDKGIVGKVSVASIKTTDSGKPTYVGYAVDPTSSVASVTFNQAIERGAGKISGICYKEFDWDNPVVLTEEDFSVTVNGTSAVFSTPNVPAGAYVLVSWEEGAFVDVVGNKCAAFSSTYNEATDKFTGVAMHINNVNWAITDAYVSPAAGASIGDWNAFTGTITMPFDIFTIEEAVKTGDLAVTYTNSNRTATYKLSADQWKASKNAISFVLPVEPTVGDVISVAVKEGILYDVYGNENDAYSSEKVVWKYVGFIPTKDMVLGTFNYIITAGEDQYDLGTFTVEEYTGEDAEDGDVLIKDLYIEGSEIYGSYDLDACKFYIYRYQPLGILNDPDEGDYGVLTYSKSGASVSPFDINPDGTLTSTDFLLAGASPDYTELWWYEVPSSSVTTFVKATGGDTAPKRAPKAKKNKIANKNFKLFTK